MAAVPKGQVPNERVPFYCGMVSQSDAKLECAQEHAPDSLRLSES